MQMDQGYVEQVLACERSMAGEPISISCILFLSQLTNQPTLIFSHLAAIMWLLRPFDVNSSKNNYQESAIEVVRMYVCMNVCMSV